MKKESGEHRTMTRLRQESRRKSLRQGKAKEIASRKAERQRTTAKDHSAQWSKYKIPEEQTIKQPENWISNTHTANHNEEIAYTPEGRRVQTSEQQPPPPPPPQPAHRKRSRSSWRENDKRMWTQLGRQPCSRVTNIGEKLEKERERTITWSCYVGGTTPKDLVSSPLYRVSAPRPSATPCNGGGGGRVRHHRGAERKQVNAYATKPYKIRQIWDYIITTWQ